MKRSFLLAITLVMVLAVSCKNTKKLTPEEAAMVEETKVELSEEVLATIDQLAADYIELCKKTDFTVTHSDQQKMVKPDYLLEPSFAQTLLSKSQKYCGLAVYTAERVVRKEYDMSTEEVDNVIAKLLVDINCPVNMDDYNNLPASEVAQKFYEDFKERGELDYFWKFTFAAQTEICYLGANTPKPEVSPITEEQYYYFAERFEKMFSALKILAEYDQEAAAIIDILKDDPLFAEDTEFSLPSFENAGDFIRSRVELYTIIRQKLLAYDLKLYF